MAISNLEKNEKKLKKCNCEKEIKELKKDIDFLKKENQRKINAY